MTAIRFAVFGKSQLAATRCHSIASCSRTTIARTWSTEQVEVFSDEDWAEALDPASVDAAIFALPPGLSNQAALKALSGGLHVLAELPGGNSVEDIVNLRAAERASGSVLKFGCGLRYHQSVHDAQALIAGGTFGRLLTARAIYGHAGFPDTDAETAGILLGHGIHMLDMLHLFCGPFEAVKAMRDTGAPGEQNLFAILRSASGTLAQLHSSATAWRQTFRLELGFEQGYVWLDGHLPGMPGYGPEVLVHAQLERNAAGKPLANPDETVRQYDGLDAPGAELSEFLDAIAGRAPLRHGTSHHAFDAMNIAQRICAATETWA